MYGVLVPLLFTQHLAIALTGDSGIGKTRIAAEYAYQRRDLYMDEGVVFFDARSPETLQQSFQQFTGESIKTSDPIVAWLDTHKNALVILDHIAPALAQQFITSEQHIFENHILFTSQQAIPGATNIPVKSLGEDAAALLILKRGGIIPRMANLTAASPIQKSSAITIAQAVGGMPVHLEAVGGLIEDTGMGIVKAAKNPTALLSLAQRYEKRAEDPTSN